MKKSLLILMFAVMSYANAGEFKPTELPEDDYVRMTITEEQRFLYQYPVEDREYILEISRGFMIPVKFLYRQHKIESQMNPHAIRHERNGSTSIGYSQINDSNLEYFSNKFNNGKTIDLLDKYENIRIGAIYMRYLVEKLEGDWIGAYMAYAWGIGNMQSDKRIPLQVIEYAFSIYYGADYTPSVEILWGAVEGMI
jgi:soluble lytic murein transglycosylase-like protein